MTFRQVVEKALGMVYQPYNTSLDVQPDPRWMKIYDWYEKRYLNPSVVVE
jgi:hypothetical protein